MAIFLFFFIKKYIKRYKKILSETYRMTMTIQLRHIQYLHLIVFVSAMLLSCSNSSSKRIEQDIKVDIILSAPMYYTCVYHHNDRKSSIECKRYDDSTCYRKINTEHDSIPHLISKLQGKLKTKQFDFYWLDAFDLTIITTINQKSDTVEVRRFNPEDLKKVDSTLFNICKALLAYNCI